MKLLAGRTSSARTHGGPEAYVNEQTGKSPGSPKVCSGPKIKNHEFLDSGPVDPASSLTINQLSFWPVPDIGATSVGPKYNGFLVLHFF